MKWRLVSLAVLTALFVAGCRTQPVYDVPSRRIGSGHDLEEVGRRIEAAVLDRGWQAERVRPGEMIATLDIRRHRAVVTILYDASQFSIRYRDSDVLMYDGEKIHRNYNHWVHNLERRILEEFGADPSAG
jgi:hypothetical protein